MADLFLFLLALFGAEAYPTGLEPLAYDGRATLGGAVAGVAAAFVSGRAAARLLRRRSVGPAPLAAQGGDEPSAEAFERYGRAVAWGQGLLLAVYLALVFLGHWPLAVGEAWEAAEAAVLRGLPTGVRAILRLPGVRPLLTIAILPFLQELLVLAPLLLSLVAWWAGRFPAERARRGGELTPGAFLRFQGRTLAVFALLPLFVLAALAGALAQMPDWEAELEVYPFLGYAGSGLLSLGLFTIAPELLRRAWGARPVPPGRLRERLEACCARAGFRCRDLVVWDTRGARVVNAFIAGIVPRFRYVFFTDALLMRLRPDQVEAVLAHEIGHAACRHIAWFLVLGLGYLALVGVSLEWALRYVGMPELAQTATALALLIVYWGALFGYVSRRFETEADLYAARLIGDPMRFAATLQQVCAMNGTPPTAGGWRHFSPARRVGFLLLISKLPVIEYRFRRRLRKLTTVVAVGVGISLAGAWRVAARQIEDAPQEWERLARARKAAALQEEADDLWRASQHAVAADRLREAVTMEGGDARLRRALADALERVGRSAEAREQYHAARRLNPKDLRLRQHLAGKLGRE